MFHAKADDSTELLLSGECLIFIAVSENMNHRLRSDGRQQRVARDSAQCLMESF